MTTKTAHWTEESVAAFRYRIAADFATQIEKKMAEIGLKRKGMAAKLRVSLGRVSQVLNDPGNLSLELIIKYARALGMKVAVIAYEDNDPKNNSGPINPEIFQACWEKQGRPKDFIELEEQMQVIASTAFTTVTCDLGEGSTSITTQVDDFPGEYYENNLGDVPNVPAWVLKEWQEAVAATSGRTIN